MHNLEKVLYALFRHTEGSRRAVLVFSCFFLADKQCLCYNDAGTTNCIFLEGPERAESLVASAEVKFLDRQICIFIKEVKEEAGLDVTADKIIAVQDRNKHNAPAYAYGICKIFVLCSVLGGQFVENIETTEFRYFALDELPELATEKNTKEQIEMCFDAYHSTFWNTVFD